MNIFLLNSKTTLDLEGNVLSGILYVYDENNNLIDINNLPISSDEPSFPSSSNTEYIYDDNNNLIRKINSSVSGLSGFTTGSTTDYIYD